MELDRGWNQDEYDAKLDRVDLEMRRHMEYLGDMVSDSDYIFGVIDAFKYMRERGEREGLSEERMKYYEKEFVKDYGCPYCG